jgi:selenide,water dikinase
VLTKPLGTGILSTAFKRDLIGEPDLAPAVRSMTTLNEGAMRAALSHGVTAATDVTGFGLLGHLAQLLEASGVGAELWFGQVPALPRAIELAAQGAAPGGTLRNLDAARVTWPTGLSQAERLLLADAQTSGGLLLAVPATEEAALRAALVQETTPAAAVIGVITAATPGNIVVTK